MKDYTYLVNDSDRESKATRILVENVYVDLIENFVMSPPVLIITELDKKVYDLKGDVDIALFEIRCNDSIISLKNSVALEVKASYYSEEDNMLKSLKEKKHIPQIKKLFKECWERVFLADIIILPPCSTWGHEKIFDIKGQFSKDVNIENCGHILFTKTAINNRPEDISGGIGMEMIKSVEKGPCIDLSVLEKIEKYVSEKIMYEDGFCYLMNCFPKESEREEVILKIPTFF